LGHRFRLLREGGWVPEEEHSRKASED
jgi:hypothetical protein